MAMFKTLRENQAGDCSESKGKRNGRDDSKDHSKPDVRTLVNEGDVTHGLSLGAPYFS